MNRSLRPLHVLLLIAAGISAFALARGLAVREAGPAVAEAAERPAAAATPAPSAEPAAGTVTAPEAVKPEPVAAAASAPEAAKSNAASVRPAFGTATAGDPFQKLSFAPPPVVAAPPPPAPPSAPRAPPLPFTFIGLLEQGGGKPAAFLARGEDLIVAAAGDVLDHTYRVDSLTPTEIVFTYLPMNERQTIALAGGFK
jgi:hypothetical protein